MGIRELIETARKGFSESASPAAVHKARKELKKARAALKLAGLKAEEKLLRDAGRALAPKRDAEVLKKQLAALPKLRKKRALKKSRARAGRRRKEALAHPSNESFHDWRKAVKILGHQLELAGGPKKEISRLEKLGDVLGKDHDLVLLEKLLKRKHAELRAKAAKLAR